MHESLEAKLKQAREGWVAFNRLRTMIAKEKYPELTAEIKALEQGND